MNILSLNNVKHNRNFDGAKPISIQRGASSQKPPKTPYSGRFLAKYRTRGKLSEILSKLGLRDEADRMKRCNEKSTIVSCGSHIVARYTNYRCENRLCPFCAERRSKKLIGKYLSPVLAYAREFANKYRGGLPCHLVLTLKHRERETPKQMRKRLWDSFTKFRDGELFKQFFDGGLFTIETKKSKDGVGSHVHLHSIVFRFRKLTKEELGQLKDEWLKVTGDSTNLFLRPVKDVRSGLVEVIKYINKPMSPEALTVAHVKQLLELKGLKMFGTFGAFWKFARDFDPSDNPDPEETQLQKFDYKEGDCCPYCNNPLFETRLMRVGELVSFARRIEAVPKREPVPV